jgi:hypothetical protein
MIKKWFKFCLFIYLLLLFFLGGGGVGLLGKPLMNGLLFDQIREVGGPSVFLSSVHMLLLL